MNVFCHACLSACTVSIQESSALHFSCVLFITFQPASERTHHCAHYSRAICSRLGMDSCPVFPHLQIRQPGPPWQLPAGAGFPRESFTGRLSSNHLLSSASKVKKLEISEALKKTFSLERKPNFFSSTSTCLTLTRVEKSCWKGPGLISSCHLPLKKDFTEFVHPPASTVEMAPTLSPSSGYPYSESWLCTCWLLTLCREAKVKCDMNLSILHLQRIP